MQSQLYTNNIRYTHQLTVEYLNTIVVVLSLEDRCAAASVRQRGGRLRPRRARPGSEKEVRSGWP